MEKLEKRAVYGANFKWNDDATSVAYFCVKLDIESSEKAAIAEKIGVKLSSLISKMNNFKLLIRGDSSAATKPDLLVYKLKKDLSVEDCRKELARLLTKEFPRIPGYSKESIEIQKLEEDFSPIQMSPEDLHSAYLAYWGMQRSFQRLNMNEMAWADFVKAASTMNIKSRGMKIEERILRNNKLQKSVMSEEGDAWLENGDGLEIKTSFITPLKGSTVSLTGIRLWEEKVKWYLLIVVDVSNLESDPVTYAMWVPKEKLDELDRAGRLSTPSMKKSASKENKNVARGLVLKTAELEEWVVRYPLPAGFLL